MNAKLMLKAPAKINIGLKVAGRRADGYHELDSVMQQISVCDALVIRRQEEGDSFRCAEPSLEGEDNLVKRAADLLRRKVGDNLPGVRLELYKNIPMGAGLGGGSSDAAAALAGLNRFWGLNLPPDELLELGAQLGSDVPFCLMGGTARVRGRGEFLEPLPALPFLWVVLALPSGLSLSTADVFRSWDPCADVVSVSASEIAEAARRQDPAGVMELMRRGRLNSLEKPVLAHYPQAAQVKNWMRELGLFPAMSGSGPTFFAFTEDYRLAREAALSLQERGCRAFLSWTYNKP